MSNSLQPPWTAAHLASLSITNSQSLLKLMSIASVMYPTISSSVIPFSSCLKSFPASESFPMSQFFASGGHSIGVSASVSRLWFSFYTWANWHWKPYKYLSKFMQQMNLVKLGRIEVKVKVISRVWLFVTPWTVAHQASPSMGFSRQEYWSGLPFPSPEDLSYPGMEPGSPTL